MRWSNRVALVLLVAWPSRYVRLEADEAERRLGIVSASRLQRQASEAIARRGCADLRRRLAISLSMAAAAVAAALLAAVAVELSPVTTRMPRTVVGLMLIAWALFLVFGTRKRDAEPALSDELVKPMLKVLAFSGGVLMASEGVLDW